jgi:N-acetylmuramoyl-L-alanine amidase
MAWDPGHGGDAMGGKVQHGVNLRLEERYFNWDLAAMANRAVQAAGWGVASSITREFREGKTLKQRGEATEGCELVISIHFDTNAAIEGARLYIPAGSPMSRAVATAIHNALPYPLRTPVAPIMVDRVQEESRAWLNRPKAVLDPHSDHAACVLLEVASVHHLREAEFVASERGKAALVAAMLCGVAVMLP